MKKLYTINGETTDYLPKILNLPDGQISPVTEATFLANGGTIEETEELSHMELLDLACDKFIACSIKIGEFIGDPSFQGGIDEIQKLHDFADQLEDPTQILIALKLVAEWEGCDKECNHWADKDDVGLHSPAWWWYAWQRYADQLEAKKGK